MEPNFHNRINKNGRLTEERYERIPSKLRMFSCLVLTSDNDLEFLKAYKRGLRSMVVDLELEILKLSRPKEN